MLNLIRMYHLTVRPLVKAFSLMPSRFALVVSAALALALVLPLNASAAPKLREVAHVEYQGMQKIRYRYGPITITPGQNVIRFNGTDLKPKVPGFITRFKPDFVRVKDNKPPPVDVLHLHHGVWLINRHDGQGLAPSFAAGEEKTIVQLPRGFGYAYKPSDTWTINDMLHNLLPTPDSVYVTWEIDFVPATSPAAATLKPASMQWMDVAGLKAYPVFNAKRAFGRGGKYTFPDQARGAQRTDIGFARRWTVPSDLTLVQTAGHLHPGGLYSDLKVTRGGVTKPLFRSEAEYFEPAGAVSWDVSMTATPASWRVRLKQGDVLSVSATYDTSKASWYEVMGIMVLAVSRDPGAGGTDPFVGTIATRGTPTHGHLKENDNHGGDVLGLPDARTLLAGPSLSGPLNITNFTYTRGDLGLVGSNGRPPTVKAGQSLTFRNIDAKKEIWHTITSCRAPCNASSGVAYPLANGPVDFDSAELGFYQIPGGRHIGGPPASGTDTWKTPSNLKPGTYNYFCRIHPFMRGAFRVKN